MRGGISRLKGGMKLNSYLLRSTVVASLGGLLFGFDTAVISGTTQALTQTFHLSPKDLGVTVSVAVVGAIFGSMLAGIPGDRFGRRETTHSGADDDSPLRYHLGHGSPRVYEPSRPEVR